MNNRPPMIIHPSNRPESAAQGAIRRLKNPLTLMPPQVRRDVEILLQVVRDSGKALEIARSEVTGARQTLTALAKQGGPFEVDHAFVQGLTAADQLQYADIDLPDGRTVKRFSHVDKAAEAEAEAKAEGDDGDDAKPVPSM